MSFLTGGLGQLTSPTETQFLTPQNGDQREENYVVHARVNTCVHTLYTHRPLEIPRQWESIRR